MAATVRRRTGTRPLSGAAGALLVFLSSGAVLVLELSALRLLAPYVGLTLEMSTAVIGVALAAIAFGTWAGGRSADRVDPARALGPLLLAGGVLIWLVLPAVRGVGELTASRDVSLVLLLADSVGVVCTLIAVLVNVVLAGVIFAKAGLVTRLIGTRASKAIAKVSSLLLAGLAVTMMRQGILSAIEHAQKSAS